MAKFAPVAPIQVLEGLFAHGPATFGNYHLLLAHHTVEHKKRFKDLFERAFKGGWTGTVIMDNSIVELGDAVSAEMVAEAVEVIREGHPEMSIFPVLPDVMGNGIETRRAVQNSIIEWTEVMPKHNGFAAVCQGENYQDYLDSLEFFGDVEAFPMIKMLTIPRVLVETSGSRIRAALSARNYIGTHQIHFLGFSDNIPDDIDSVKIIPEAGIDSAVPLRYPEVFTEFIDAGKRPPKWFEEAQVDKQMIANLTAARRMFA